ncbi:MAG TPA: DNA translocase FtsK, partial [Planctomycetaceae bacterium]|nr:DNA translocase FtsK [Planctomycetaceae bacterium]
MTQERKIEFDIEALVLAAICVFMWLSLLSHSPADRVSGLAESLYTYLPLAPEVYPANIELQNTCGWFGALVSRLLLQALGAGAFLVVTGLTVLTVWMFRVQSNYVRASRQIGWTLVIVAFTTFVAVLDIRLPTTPLIGPGGYLGAMTSTWLHEHFAIFGSLILTLTVLLTGLLLSTDYVVVRAIYKALFSSATVAGAAAAATKKRVRISAPQRRVITDVEDGVRLEGEDDEEGYPALKIRQKPRTSEAAEEEEDEVTGEEVDDEPQAAPGGLLGKAKAMVSSALGTNSADDVEAEEELDDEVYEEEDAEFREVAVGDELVVARTDEAHEGAPTPAGPRVTAPAKKKKKAPEPEQDDSLAMLDDTKLPDGAEEYVLPGIDLLLESDDVDYETQAVEVRRKAKILEKTFKDFGFNVRVVEIETGPVIAQYEVELEAGLRLSKITGLSDDLAIALRVPSVRIVAPIPGKNTVGIEVPNETRQVVRLREVIEEQTSKMRKSKIPLFLGKDVSGNALAADLATLPHLLIAGRTGTGKSVALNAIIASILMTKKPDEVRMLMIDPKMVELSGYGRLPHLMHPVVTDMKKAEAILAWAVDKMEERYTLLARAGVRHLTSYNELGREEILDRLKPETEEEAEAIPDHLPFIVIVADEMADLMMTAGKEVEQHIIRLAQKSRAVGIHLILATQKPTVDVITGLIKSNLPARISFQVASRTDSRVVLDEMGADKLLGNGDMLFLWPGTSMLLRGQGTYLSDEEINSIVDHCSTGEQNFVNELVNLKVKEEGDEDAVPGALKKRDELYSAAVDVVVREGRGSCSLLQRALGIGYGRAARLIDYMAEDGIVGQYAGSQARDVLLSVSDWEAMQSGEGGGDDAAPPAAPAKPAKKAK